MQKKHQMIEKFINIKNFKNSFKKFNKAKPFSYAICDNFLQKVIIDKLLNEFPDYYEKNCWHEYNNPIEVKKTCNNWNIFGPNTYKFIYMLNSSEFINLLSKFTKIKNLYPDYGLNGGGLHIHRNGGKLNHHLDYIIHPKIDYQRKINFLLYLNPKWEKSYGGELGFWSHDKKKNLPKKLEKIFIPKYNRAIFFDTTQNSWHGLVNPIKNKSEIFRKSIAIYYLTKKSNVFENRFKALFAPNEKQKDNQKIIDLIKKRSSLKKAKNVYIKK